MRASPQAKVGRRAELKTIGLILMIASSVVSAGNRTPAAEASDLVARVNGDPVRRTEVERLLADPLERQHVMQELSDSNPDAKQLNRLALRELIHRRLVLQEADRRNIVITDQELDRAISSLRRRFVDLESLGAWMQQRGLDDKSLFEELRANMLIARVTGSLVQDVRVDPQQMRKYFETHIKKLKTEDLWLQMIVVSDRRTAEGIQASLRDGKDFGALAQETSIGRRAAQGGDMGWVNSEALWPAVREAVATLEPGQAIGPLPRSDGEFLVVRLEARRPGRAKTFLEAEREIERSLLAETQQQTLEAWIAEQEAKSNIEVFQ
jgi:foldase protein PrsA